MRDRERERTEVVFDHASTKNICYVSLSERPGERSRLEQLHRVMAWRNRRGERQEVLEGDGELNHFWRLEVGFLRRKNSILKNALTAQMVRNQRCGQEYAVTETT